MEIEEMQALWSEMSDQLEQQKKLTNEIIMKMTQERYSRKFQTIFTFEALGAILCFLLAIGLFVNFHKLDNWYLILSGVFTMSILIFYPVFILSSLLRFKRLSVSEKSYRVTLFRFMKEKKRILNFQKVATISYLFLMPASLVVAAKIISNKNFITMEKSAVLYIVTAITFLMAALVAGWGYNYYKRILSSAENVLKELEG